MLESRYKGTAKNRYFKKILREWPGQQKNSTERGKFGSKSPDTLTTAQGLRRFDSIDKIDNSMQ